MITNYRTKSKKKISERKPLVAILVSVMFLAVVFAADRFFPQQSFKTLEPVATVLWSMSDKLASMSNDAKTLISSKQKLEDENQELRRKIFELSSRLTILSSLEGENAFLKEMWARKESGQPRLARVLLGPSNSFYDSLIIDLGLENEAQTGLKVYAPGGFLLGMIEEVFNKTSRVRLFSNPGMVTDAVLERSGATLSLKGNGAGNFSVLVPKQEEVEIGDLVVMPSLSSKPIAVVSGVESSEADSFKELLLSLPVNIFELKWVEVGYGQ
jgi:cell shape-determining protein MreC